MFISQFSGKQSDPYITPTKVVTKKRAKVYTNHDGKQSFGWEIVEEMWVHPDEVAAVQLKYPAPTPIPDRSLVMAAPVIPYRERNRDRDRDDRRRDRY